MSDAHPLTTRFARTVDVDVGEWPSRLGRAIRTTGRTVRDQLAATHRLVDDDAVTDIDLALPPILEAMVACACAAAARDEDEAARSLASMPTVPSPVSWISRAGTGPWQPLPPWPPAIEAPPAKRSPRMQASRWVMNAPEL